MRVRFNRPDDELLHNETGVVVDRPNSDEALVRFDRMKPEFMAYEDMACGFVTSDPVYLDQVDAS
jgi:hypothetical protein